ncbi:hypothetical protein QUF63_13900 [Anaerolineales bacterium HSG25]|nr:hypothetical protein [Anaerolineales bacterium HSG25]
MLAQTFRGPHNLYRRYQASLEGAITAFGLAVVVTLTLSNLAVYPSNWVWLIGTAIAIVGARSPMIGLSLSVVAITYPLFAINFYLAVIFIAISLLGHRYFVHYLGATVLILATPLLAEFHLHWLVPIFVGLWWGGVTGAWVGGLACLWGKIIGGIVGFNIDWLVMAGQPVDIRLMNERFADSNSLETLLLLVEPFASDPDIMLYNLLQIIGWAVAAGVVGTLAQHKWVKYRTPWSILIVTTVGGLILMVTHLALPYWLSNAVSNEAMQVVENPIEPFFSLLLVIIIGTVVYSVRERLDLPVAPKRSNWIRQRQSKPTPTQPATVSRSPFNLFKRSKRSNKQDATASQPIEKPREPVQVPDYNQLPEWKPPKDESGLIMLEMD